MNCFLGKPFKNKQIHTSLLNSVSTAAVAPVEKQNEHCSLLGEARELLWSMAYAHSRSTEKLQQIIDKKTQHRSPFTVLPFISTEAFLLF